MSADHAPHPLLWASSRQDGWLNELTGLGTSRDKSRHHQLQLEHVSPLEAERQLRADGLAARIVTIPIDDGLAGGHELVLTDQKGERSKDLGAKLEARRKELDRADLYDDGVHSAEHRALVLARALGGAALMPIVDDRQPLEVPMRWHWGAPLRIIGYDVLDLRELVPLAWDSLGRIDTWQVVRRVEGSSTAAPVVRVHASRLIRAHGVTSVRAPETGVPLPGWPGDSCFVGVIEHLRRYSGSVAGVGALLADFAQMVYRIKGLAATRGRDDMFQLVMARLRLIDAGRSIVRGVALDADSESAERVTTSLAGYSEATDRVALALSAASGIPATRLLGRSPDGMNATGASDTTNLHALVRSYQAERVEPLHLAQYRWLLREEGLTPADWRLEIKYAPLTQPTELEQADARLKTAQRDQIEIQSGVVTAAEVARSRYGGDRYSAETTITPEVEVEDETEEQTAPGAVDVVRGVNDGTIKRAQAIQLLIQVYGRTEEQAELMLGPEEELEPEEESEEESEPEEEDDAPDPAPATT